VGFVGCGLPAGEPGEGVDDLEVCAVDLDALNPRRQESAALADRARHEQGPQVGDVGLLSGLYAYRLYADTCPLTQHSSHQASYGTYAPLYSQPFSL